MRKLLERGATPGIVLGNEDEGLGMTNWTRNDQTTQEMISLVGGKVAMLSVIATWTDQQCMQADAWASACHFSASDKAAPVPMMPSHLAVLPDQAKGAYDADLSHL